MTISNPKRVEFKIHPATEEDCYTLAEIEAIANTTPTKTDPSQNPMKIIFGPPSKSSHEFRAKGLVDKLKDDRDSRMWKAVISDENGSEKIVAWAHWFFYNEPPTIEWNDIEWPAPINGEGANEFLRNGHALRAKYMTGKRFGFLSVLATLLEYRGNGIGSALIERGLREAKDLNLSEFWLDASEDGHDLYVKYGFEDVELIPLNLEKYGGVGQVRVMSMNKVSGSAGIVTAR